MVLYGLVDVSDEGWLKAKHKTEELAALEKMNDKGFFNQLENGPMLCQCFDHSALAFFRAKKMVSQTEHEQSRSSLCKTAGLTS